MSIRDPRTLHARELLALHDAGHFGMPDLVLDARATLDAMRKSEKETAETWAPLAPGDVEQRLAEEMVAGAPAGVDAMQKVIAEIERAEQKQRAAEMAVRVARLAVEMAELRLVAAIDETRDETIVAYLRPALRETLEEVRGVATALEGADLRRPESLLGDAQRGKAYLRLVDANWRHGAIRGAQRHLAGGNLPDPPEVALYRNAPEIFARAGLDWRSRRQFGRVPWPEHGLDALVWTATDPIAEPWIPTAAEFQEVAEEIASKTRLRAAPTMVG